MVRVVCECVCVRAREGEAFSDTLLCSRRWSLDRYYSSQLDVASLGLSGLRAFDSSTCVRVHLRAHRVGVAPRAKINQQRLRRFASSFAREELEQESGKVGEYFDSNAITPGTEFLEKVSSHLRYFIRSKIHSDSNWQQVQVILAGPEVRACWVHV